jgi:hypothetical protein
VVLTESMYTRIVFLHDDLLPGIISTNRGRGCAGTACPEACPELAEGPVEGSPPVQAPSSPMGETRYWFEAEPQWIASSLVWIG